MNINIYFNRLVGCHNLLLQVLQERSKIYIILSFWFFVSLTIGRNGKVQNPADILISDTG